MLIKQLVDSTPVMHGTRKTVELCHVDRVDLIELAHHLAKFVTLQVCRTGYLLENLKNGVAVRLGRTAQPRFLILQWSCSRHGFDQTC